MSEAKIPGLTLCDNCPGCGDEMTIIYNAFFTIPFIVPQPVIKGQVCGNNKCLQYGIERRHKDQNRTMTSQQYSLFKHRGVAK
ncbi:hypothetical protein LCGC14_1979270 [marine sediment metagenome]|uniref:Uncharacterized protein n=1 Tax=marine sediment metagenome TaxID=412755 RepID=A0A0F9I6D1_9ZZZZ